MEEVKSFMWTPPEVLFVFVEEVSVEYAPLMHREEPSPLLVVRRPPFRGGSRYSLRVVDSIFSEKQRHLITINFYTSATQKIIDNILDYVKTSLDKALISSRDTPLGVTPVFYKTFKPNSYVSRIQFKKLW